MSDDSDEPGTQIETYVAPPPAGSGREVVERMNQQVSGPLTIQPSGGAVAQAMSVQAMSQIRLQMEMAMAYPRDETDISVRIYDDCQNPEFADKALYSFPRGRDTVTGPSIVLAEQIGRRWGNLKWGFSVIEDTEEKRTIRAYCWDLQSNIQKEADITFAKLVEKKVHGGPNQWVAPDERGLIELTNRNASKGVRNAILGCIPDRVKRDAVSWCRQRIAKADGARSPEQVRKNFAIHFAKAGVTPAQLKEYLGHPIEQATDAELEALRGIGNRIKTGDATWHDIMAERAEQTGGPSPRPRNNAEAAEAAARASKKNGGG